MILDSRGVEYEVVDIAEPGRQAERDRLKSCGAAPPALPPQMFNGDDYCGDYDQFDLSNEIDELEKFLKVELPADNNLKKVSSTVENGISNSHENTPEKVIEETTSAPKDFGTENLDANSTLISNEKEEVKENENSKEIDVPENEKVVESEVTESAVTESTDKEVEEDEEDEESENDEE